MVYILTLLAIAIGLAIGRKYSPKNKLHKFLMAVLLPLVSGVIIAIIIASLNNSPYFGFWYRLGQTMVPVIIAVLAMIITLLVKLKVKNNDTTLVEKIVQKLHYDTGDNRVDFEIELSEQEITKIEELRKQNPDKWRDNDYELVKEAKKQLELQITEEENDAKQQTANTSIVSNEPTEFKLQKVELQQNGIAVTMELSKEIIEQMEVLRQEQPQKWIDNEVELVRVAKKRLQGIVDLEELEKTESGSTNEKSTQSETSSNPNIEVQPSQSIFGDKLESEYRRETKADSHWIRQDDTEICISIEEDVYRKMVEMQNENPKKWVNKELDLYQKAKKSLLEPKSKSRRLFN